MILADRVAIVTGAGNGIGKATALALARAGAQVAAVDVDGGAAKVTADAVAALGPRSLALDTDVGDLAAIDRMVKRVMETFGRIDVLVNNAGVTRRAYIMDLTEQDWDRIMRVNAKGVFFCLQRVAREMIPRRSGRHHQHRVDRGQGLRGHLERDLRGEQGQRDLADPHRRAAARPPRHQRQRDLPRHHGHRALGGQRGDARPRRGRLASRR